jgi:hypothetical protein
MTEWLVPEGTPRVSAVLVEAFVHKYRGSRFPHEGEVLPILIRDSPGESRIAMYVLERFAEVREIYGARARLAAARSAVHVGSPRATMAEDLRLLVEQLDAASEQAIHLWSVALPDGTVYNLFELAEDQRIAGCTKVADQRVLDMIANRRVPGT